jgi:hypothetical protein
MTRRAGRNFDVRLPVIQAWQKIFEYIVSKMNSQHERHIDPASMYSIFRIYSIYRDII